MADPELNILIKIRDEATASLNHITSEVNSIQKPFLQLVGIMSMVTGGLMGIGGVIAGFVKLTAVAEEEDAAIGRLSVALKNVGMDYTSVGDILARTFEDAARRTNYSIDQQREGLSRLVFITHDYNTSLNLMTLTMDIAAARNMDLVSAATIVGRVMEGNTRGLTSLIGAIDEHATATENIARLTAAYGGAAEATVKPLTQLQNINHELAQTIGQLLKPATEAEVSGLVELESSLIETIHWTQRWLDAQNALNDSLLQGKISLWEYYSSIFKVKTELGDLKGSADEAKDAVDEVTAATERMNAILTEHGIPIPKSYIQTTITPSYSSAATVINNYIQGSVVTERQIANINRRAMLNLKDSNVDVGLA